MKSNQDVSDIQIRKSGLQNEARDPELKFRVGRPFKNIFSISSLFFLIGLFVISSLGF